MQQKNWLIFYVLDKEMNKTIDITIIVPFYNGNKYIKGLIEMVGANVAEMQEASVELIIVNDSPWIKVEGISERTDFEIKVLNFPDNVGIQGARVRGLKAARGKYVHMLDQDDSIDKLFLAKTYKAIGNNDVAVSNGWRRLPSGDKPIYLTMSKHKKISSLFYYVYLENRILSPGHCLIKKKSIPNEWYKLQLKNNGADDLVLWILMLCKKAKFIIVPEKLYNHIDTGENVSSDDLMMAESTIEACNILRTIKYVPKWIIIRKLKGGYRS